MESVERVVEVVNDSLFSAEELAQARAAAEDIRQDAEAFAAWCQMPAARAEWAELMLEAEKVWGNFEAECAAGKYSLPLTEMEQLVQNECIVKCHPIKRGRWADLPQLRKDGQRVLHWIQETGIVVCWDPALRKTVAQYLLPIFQALRETIQPLSLVCIYLYRQADQPPNMRTDDGIFIRYVDGIQWVDVTPDRGKLYAIGLSAEALDKGKDYVQFLFLHELAHILSGGKHSKEFHRCLDGLIERFNKYTGSHIVNDYC